MKVAYIFPPPWDPVHPSYTLALFAGSTRHHNHIFHGFDLNVDLFNAATDEDRHMWNGQHAVKWTRESDRMINQYASFLDTYLARIVELDISLVAIYVSGVSKKVSLWLAQQIKAKSPDTGIILGGPQCFPAYNDELFLLKHDGVDATCSGEADNLWPKILDTFSQKGNFHIDLPGITYKKSDGATSGGGVPELVNKLDKVPFADYSSVNFSAHGAYRLAVMGSRGCINTCAFCSERPNFYKYRYRSAENIFEEIVGHLQNLQNREKTGHQGKPKTIARFMQLIQNNLSWARRLYSWLKTKAQSPGGGALGRGYGKVMRRFLSSADMYYSKSIPYIAFNDSLINGRPKELEKFCDLVIESGVKFNWGGMALLRKEMSKELLTKMNKAGCCNVSWGLESGSQDVLNLMKKRFFTMDLAKEVIKNASDAGISQSCALIVGFPGETEKMFQETVQFLKEYGKYFQFTGKIEKDR